MKLEYSVRFTEEGKKKLHELHIVTQREIKKGLKELTKNIDLRKALVGRLSGFYSFAIGKYRAIYSVKKYLIMVHYVGHRKNAYSDFGNEILN